MSFVSKWFPCPTELWTCTFLSFPFAAMYLKKTFLLLFTSILCSKLSFGFLHSIFVYACSYVKTALLLPLQPALCFLVSLLPHPLLLVVTVSYTLRLYVGWMAQSKVRPSVKLTWVTIQACSTTWQIWHEENFEGTDITCKFTQQSKRSEARSVPPWLPVSDPEVPDSSAGSDKTVESRTIMYLSKDIPVQQACVQQTTWKVSWRKKDAKQSQYSTWPASSTTSWCLTHHKIIKVIILQVEAGFRSSRAPPVLHYQKWSCWDLHVN